MKQVIMLAIAAMIFVAGVHSAQAAKPAFGGHDSASKKTASFISINDGSVVEKKKQKRKRKHTGLDDGPNHN